MIVAKRTTAQIMISWALVVAMVVAPRVASSQETGGTHSLTMLSEGIYAVQANFQGANATIIINDESVLIVDSHGSTASAEALLEEVARLTDLPVRYVVNTHWHADHHTGNQAYYRAFPGDVEFISHHSTREDIPTLGKQQLVDVAPFMRGSIERAEEQLRTGLDDHGNPLTSAQRDQIERFTRAQAEFLDRIEDFEFVLPNLTFERSLVLHSPRRSIQILYFHRAHTRGDVVVYLPDEGILIAGDLLTKPILWSWSSYPEEYIQTLRALERLEFDRIVIGHGDVLSGKDYLVQAREFLESVVSFVRLSIAAETSLEHTLEGAAESQTIQSFRDQFVGEARPENDMFNQMVAWTAERAYREATGDLE